MILTNFGSPGKTIITRLCTMSSFRFQTPNKKKTDIQLCKWPVIVLLLLIALLIGSFVVASDLEKKIGSNGSVLLAEKYADFNEPWAMTFLPSGEILVTEKSGTLLLVSADGQSKVHVEGVPQVAYGGQGGLGDVIVDPDYEKNGLIYISYAEKGRFGRRGAAVARARFSAGPNNPKLHDLEVIWRQTPKVKGSGHYSHRLTFSPDGKLFITSGERQKQKPAQDWSQNLGKVIRLNPDGSVPPDNPFQDKGKLAKTFWSLGHRNLLGIAFDSGGRLWTHEMGPRHGDELNLTIGGDNYGWPIVSWGNQYSGVDIPDHDTRPDFNAPEVYWVPSIAPSGLIIYSGTMFADWQGDAVIGGLVSTSLIRVKITGDNAEEIERFAMGKRIREVEQGKDGAIWVLEDKAGGRLLRLTPQQ
ncbi:MAG: glucose/arabinose dehydrogenase [Desulforhopalus sp.]|jgi:glucose/arabinose dehydrogenase